MPQLLLLIVLTLHFSGVVKVDNAANYIHLNPHAYLEGKAEYKVNQ